jgi:hypothetical protein
MGSSSFSLVLPLKIFLIVSIAPNNAVEVINSVTTMVMPITCIETHDVIANFHPMNVEIVSEKVVLKMCSVK